MIFGLLHGLLTVPLGLSQHVTGLGITLLATSLTYFTYRMILPDVLEPAAHRAVSALGSSRCCRTCRCSARRSSSQTALTYLAFARSDPGRLRALQAPRSASRCRSVGENPAAAEAQGIDVYRMRIGAVMAGSALMAIGGAFLTMSAFNAFFFEMVAGRGWICIALVVFASWRPGKALLGALLFGAFDAFQVRLQQVVGGVPYQVFLMLPYLFSILALIVMARRAGYPRALMVPYRKGER